MSRAYRFLGWAYVAACSTLTYAFAPRAEPAAALVESPVVAPPRAAVRVAPSTPADPSGPAIPPTPGLNPLEWFRRAKPYCNAVEIAVLQRSAPPPSGPQGAGYHAACFALAGKVDDARRIINELVSEERALAAYIVFEVGHPVADAGDDRSAGPIMELVIDYVPNHYMALYHAGMAEYMLGQRDLARKNIEAFLALYQQNDGWRSNGLDVLKRLDDSTNANVDRRRPREPGQ